MFTIAFRNCSIRNKYPGNRKWSTEFGSKRKRKKKKKEDEEEEEG